MLQTVWVVPVVITGAVIGGALGWLLLHLSVAVILWWFAVCVISHVCWTRYIWLPRWLQSVVTEPTLPKPKALQPRGYGS